MSPAIRALEMTGATKNCKAIAPLSARLPELDNSFRWPHSCTKRPAVEKDGRI
jgi:hypothetical protein